MMGKITSKLRLPLDLPSEEHQRQIRRTLVKYGLLAEEPSKTA